MAGGVPCSGSGILLSSILHPPPSVDPRTGCCSLLHLVALGCTWLHLVAAIRKKKWNGRRDAGSEPFDCGLRIADWGTRVRSPHPRKSSRCFGEKLRPLRDRRAKTWVQALPA